MRQSMPSPYYPGKHVTNVQLMLVMLVNILIRTTIKIKCLCVNRGSNNKCNIASSFFAFAGKPTPVFDPSFSSKIRQR